MRRIDVMKKRPSKWPWVIGVIVLGLALWGATVLLRPPADDGGPELPVTAADTLPPAQIPLTRDGARATPEPPSLSELMPLDEEQVGEPVKIDGEVVATGNHAFWVLVGSQVIRVDSRQRARKGETLSLEGVLRASETDTTDRMAEVISREPGSEAWTIINAFKVVEDGSEDDADADTESDTEPDTESDSGDGADATDPEPEDGD